MVEIALSHGIVLSILLVILFRERESARLALGASICFFCGFTGYSMLPVNFGVPVGFALGLAYVFLDPSTLLRSPLPRSVFLWLGIVAASVFMSYAIAGPVDGMVPWGKSINQLVAHVAFVMTGVAIAAVIGSFEDLRKLIGYLIMGSLFASVFALLQLLFVDMGYYSLADLFWNNPSYGGVVAKNSGLIPAHIARSRLGITRVWGPAMEPSYLGSYLTFVLLVWLGFLLERPSLRRPLNHLGVIVLLAAIVATQARGAFIALAVGLTGLFLARIDIQRLWRRLLAGAGIALVVVAVWIGTASQASVDPVDIAIERFGFLAATGDLHEDYSAGARLAALRISWDMAVDYPLLGVGIGNYGFHVYDYIRTEYRYKEFRAGEWHVPFGWPATIIAETGLLGTLAFLASLLALLRMGAAVIRRPEWRELAGLYWGFVSLTLGGIAGSQVITPYWWVAIGIISACFGLACAHAKPQQLPSSPFIDSRYLGSVS